MWVGEEMKMSEFKKEDRYLVMKRSDIKSALDGEMQSVLQHIAQTVEGERYSLGKTVLECVVVESDWPIYDDVWKMVEAVANNCEIKTHDRLVEENRRLTELAAQKAGRADELFGRMDKSQMLINSVGLILMNDTLTAKEKERQLKSLFDIHGDEIYLDNRDLLDKIKQESE